MFVELLPAAVRQKMHQLHARMTARALVVIFEFAPEAADEAVGRFLHVKGFGEIPGAADRLLHEDPVNLATDIAGHDLSQLGGDPFADRVRRFDAEARPEFEAEAVAFHQTDVAPLMSKRSAA